MQLVRIEPAVITPVSSADKHILGIDDDILRRDAIHASINALPDPNYATLRHLVLHLNKLQQYSHINRMNTNNLAICFGPTVMRSTQHQDVSEAAFAVRVVQTILDHALEIFDED